MKTFSGSKNGYRWTVREFGKLCETEIVRVADEKTVYEKNRVNVPVDLCLRDLNAVIDFSLRKQEPVRRDPALNG